MGQPRGQSKPSRKCKSSADSSFIASGGIPGQTDYDVQGASNYPSDGRALPHSYRLMTGGNPRLEAETADTWTFGVVWQSSERAFTISADWYEIEIDNVVAGLGFLAAYQQCFNSNGTSNPTFDPKNEYCQRITRDPVNSEPLLVYGGNYNFSQRLTSGIDLSVDWSRHRSAKARSAFAPPQTSC